MFGKVLSFRKKYRILLFLQKFRTNLHFDSTIIDSKRNQAYIFLAADYGNLGDVAITYAQTKFLQQNTKYQVIEIPISKSLEGLHFVRKHIKEADIITTVGGGNLGDLYDQIEFIRQLVVQFFPDNKIISFPQTFDFSDTPKGKKSLFKAKEIYNKHKDLYIVAREKISFHLMEQHFYNAKILLTPDIVLSLDELNPTKRRKGAVICMRTDSEKSLTKRQNDFIVTSINQSFSEVDYYDTHIGRDKITIKEREKELRKIWDKFKGAELVVTDRLHGMIFSYITNTPCLVFQNNNHKVKGTYNWIKKNKNIKLVEEFDKEVIENFLKMKHSIDGTHNTLSMEYQPLISIL